MVRSVTLFDEDWTEEDLAAVLDWQTEQSLRCPGCGLPMDETTSPEKEDAYSAEIVACHACATGDRAERHYQEANGETAGARRRIWESDG